jgi:hypothetical protein
MKRFLLPLITILCVTTLYSTDSSDDDKKQLKIIFRSDVSNIPNHTIQDKPWVRTGIRNRMSGQSSYRKPDSHQYERLLVEATIARSSLDDITYYFNEQLQNKSFSEHELLTWYDLYHVPAYCAYIATLPGYEEHIQHVRKQLNADRKTAEKTAKAMGLKPNEACELIEPLYNEVRRVQGKRKYQQQCQEAEQVKALHRQAIKNNQQHVMALEQITMEDWKAGIDDVPDVQGARYKKRIAAVPYPVWREETYLVSVPMHTMLIDQQLDPDAYATFYGNGLQHVLHGEFVDVVNQIAPIHARYTHITGINGLTTFAVQMADIGVAYNKEGATARASLIADVSWAALDCIAAAVEGIEGGVMNTVDMVMHPLETVYSFGRGAKALVGAAKALGSYHFAMMVAIGQAELYKDTDYRCPPDNFHEKIIHLQQTQDRFYTAAAELKVRDCVKGVALFATECCLQARILKAVGTLAGKSAKTLVNCAEKVADLVPKPKILASLPEGACVEVVEQIMHAAALEEKLFNLVKKAENVYVSLAGLIYGPDKKFGNRIYHVLQHTKEILGKTKHTIFNIAGEELFNLIDEAWLKRGAPLPHDLGVHVVDLGRVIGTQGETAIRIVVEEGTSMILTAYPVKI